MKAAAASVGVSRREAITNWFHAPRTQLEKDVHFVSDLDFLVNYFST